jgi:hypothetical protein
MSTEKAEMISNRGFATSKLPILQGAGSIENLLRITIASLGNFGMVSGSEPDCSF